MTQLLLGIHLESHINGMLAQSSATQLLICLCCTSFQWLNLNLQCWNLTLESLNACFRCHIHLCGELNWNSQPPPRETACSLTTDHDRDKHVFYTTFAPVFQYFFHWCSQISYPVLCSEISSKISRDLSPS